MAGVDSSTEPLPGKNHQAYSSSRVAAAAAPTTVASDAAAAYDDKEQQQQEDMMMYRALIVDSGPMIRLTGLSSLRNCAKQYYTVPAVIQEIRDAKARQHLENLPFELITKEASPEGIQAMVDFSRQTGDYRNLSAVDLQVLGLLYDLEREGCQGDMTHVRKTPKRTLGVGKIESLAKEAQAPEKCSAAEDNQMEVAKDTEPTTEHTISFFKPLSIQDNNLQEETFTTQQQEDNNQSVAGAGAALNAPAAPKTWAMLVNPTVAVSSPPSMKQESKVADKPLHVTFGSMDLSTTSNTAAKAPQDEEIGGQFSDAEEEDDFEEHIMEDNDYSDDDDDDDGYADNEKEISDEECDVYILDPEEVEERKRRRAQQGGGALNAPEIESDFPSLTAAMHVPCDGSDDDSNDDEDTHKNPAILAKEIAESRKKQALQPLTSSGKLYNSFRKYGDLVKPKEGTSKEKTTVKKEEPPIAMEEEIFPGVSDGSEKQKEAHSRIMGGMTMSGQGVEVDDDGEGWVTCTRDIRNMKAAGALDPSRCPNSNSDMLEQPKQQGPPQCQRAACATTDFAMQNVILQMNLELLSVDGIKVRRLKSWVTRCGACFAVYADGAADSSTGPQNMKRLFCARCGSDFLQRVAASVDGKTGRLRLHLSKKYKNNLRGTKYSLPKAGTGNRFQGDLLLREDQLLVGAWNQKVKKQTGGKARGSAQSIFGSDLASSVGCHADMRDDIKVGFGRRNPNASKHGRERRGKKKKTSDKACGLRRY